MTTPDAPTGATAAGSTGFKGELSIRVIRAHPTLRQRLADWFRSLRRF